MTSNTMAVEFAEAYFTPRAPRFWRWSEAGCREIEGLWESPNLIVFRDQLTEILGELQPRGWPPLPALLLCCAATRRNWPHGRTELERLLVDGHSDRTTFVAELLDRLDRIHQLPQQLRESREARIEIARMVFEDSPFNISSGKAAAALDYLRRVLPLRDPATANEVTAEASRLARPTFGAEFRGLSEGLLRVSKGALESRLRTGLDQEVQAAPISIPPAPSSHTARLIEWMQDRELFAAARIARKLASLLSTPRRMSEPEDVSSGGVSDLTNRGPLDRLLLSELAHDDDTLAVRIALNEAMYLRRESPASPQPHRRTVLVDTGLRSWGRPRVFAAAVALAIASLEDHDPDLTVSVDVTDLGSWKSVDLTSRDGAVELLSSLSHTLHPATSVTAWSRHGIPDELPCEPILVTVAETLDEPEVERALGELPDDYQVALVSADGRFELRQHTASGWRVVRTAALDLDELLVPPAATRPLSLHSHREPDRFPLILRVTPFPLRVSAPLEIAHCWTLPDKRVISQASGNRLLIWDGPQRGAIQLSTAFPPGKIEASSTGICSRSTGPSVVSYFVIRGSKWQLARVDTHTAEIQVLDLGLETSASDQTISAVLIEQCALLIGRGSISAFSLENGSLLGHLPLTGAPLESVGNRYLRDSAGHWYRVSFDGAIHLTVPKRATRSKLLVDLPASTEVGPLAIPEWMGLKFGKHGIPSLQIDEITRACQRGPLVMLQGRFREWNWVLGRTCTAVWDLAADEWKWNLDLSTDFGAVARNHAVARSQPRQGLRRKFSAIHSTSDRFRLQTTRDWWQLVLVNDRLRIVPAPAKTGNSEAIPLEQLKWPGMGTRFRTATLPNGNAVWIDSRGLMHLLPANPSQPEITLVLDENNVSGWISNGTFFGDSYYSTSGLPAASVGRVWELFLAPFFGIDCG